jgi:glutathione S-transferase
MQLYSTPASPFARKVRAVIHETGLQDAVVITDVTVTPMAAEANIAAHNPIAKVPTLVTDDGTALFDSRVICEYLDGLKGAPTLFPAAGPARFRALTLQALGDGIMDAGVLMRYEQVIRPKDLYWQDWLDAQGAKALRAIAVLESRATDLPAEADIGTITIACALSYLDFRFGDLIDWRAGAPRLAGWYAAFAERPAMQATALIDPNAAKD